MRCLQGMEEDRKLDELINRRQQAAMHANAAVAAPIAREPDAALDALADVPMGRFSPAQVEEWLLAVATSLYTQAGSQANDNNGAESAEKTLALQMVRMIKFLVAKKVRESSTATQTANGNGTAAVAQKLKEKKQAEIAELSKGLFGSTMAGRKRLFSATSTTESSSGAASQVAKKPSTNATPSTTNDAKPSTNAEEKSMAGQALLTLSLYDVTRMIRQLQQQIAQQAENGGKMDIDGDGDEEEDDDEARSLVSASVTSKPLARAVVPAEIVTELLGASASETIFWWTENVMTKFETHFRLAINRRARMDTHRKESERSKRQEAHRLFVEQQPSSLMETVLQKKAAQATPAPSVSTNAPPNAATSATAPPASSEAVDAAFDDLEALVGGPITVVRAAEVQAPAPVAVKKEPTPATVKVEPSTNPTPPVSRPKKFVVK